MLSQKSVLETNDEEPSRPQSQKELKFIQNKVKKLLNLGDVMANHKLCGHYYYVKKNGRKEKDINSSGDSDTINCSVCWRISKTERKLLRKAKELWLQYDFYFKKDKSCYISYYDIDIETTFYKWLYFG